MSNGPSGRFLHSGSMLSSNGGLMLIYGGNIHNDTGVTLVSSGGQCYTAQPLLYDTYCDSWTQMPLPSNLFTSLMRFGHSSIIFEKSTYIYGGFNGQMLNDILKYKRLKLLIFALLLTAIYFDFCEQVFSRKLFIQQYDNHLFE